MKVWHPDPPERALRVLEVVEIDFGLFAPPVKLGPEVRAMLHEFLTGRVEVIDRNPDLGSMSAEGPHRYLVRLVDGRVARGTRELVDKFLAQCGQEPII